MIRIEMRCPQPPRFSNRRSGALVLDFHNIHLFPGGSSGEGSTLRARFAEFDVPGEASDFSSRQTLQNMPLLDVGRIVVAHSLAGEGKAYLLVSLGPLALDPISPSVATPRYSGMGPSSVHQELSSSAISISINKTISRSRKQGSGALVITADVPSVFVNLNKPLLDGLQYWVDDVSQLGEHVLADRPKDSASERGLSRNSSLLGSHYFAQSSGESELEVTTKKVGESASETVLGLSVAEGQ